MASGGVGTVFKAKDPSPGSLGRRRKRAVSGSRAGVRGLTGPDQQSWTTVRLHYCYYMEIMKPIHCRTSTVAIMNNVLRNPDCLVSTLRTLPCIKQLYTRSTWHARASSFWPRTPSVSALAIRLDSAWINACGRSLCVKSDLPKTNADGFCMKISSMSSSVLRDVSGYRQNTTGK